jgi:succinate dehydrogenase / fumarate reductase iron-sulfur subunit
VADLVVDTANLAETMERVRAHNLQEDGSVTRFSNCIECGLCVSACPISAINRNYLGPAVLAAGSKNTENPEVRAQLGGNNGVWRCHDVHECTEVCPSDVQPAFAIGMLRIDLLNSKYKRKE